MDWNKVHTHCTPEEAYSEAVKLGGESAKKFIVEAIRKKYKKIEDILSLYLSNRWVLHLVFREGRYPTMWLVMVLSML